VGIWVGKENSPFLNVYSYLDTHLRVVIMVLIASKNVYFLDRFFSTSGHILGPNLERSGIMGWKAKFFISECVLIFGYPFESCKRGLD
jgi:hypothetical protein